MLKKQIEQEQHREFNKKVAIIGSGYVGAGIAYSMMIKDIAREIVLIDTKENVANAEMLDIRHGITNMGSANVYCGDYSDIKDDRLKKIGMDADEFKKLAFELYKSIQEEWMNFDYEGLRKHLTDELYNSYVMQLDALKVKGQQNIMKDFENIDVKITNITEESGIVNVTVYLHTAMYDYVVDNNKKTVRGKDNHKIDIEYSITFVKASDEILNKCPNCGAPFEGVAGGKCEYCGSTIVIGPKEYVMSKKTCIGQRMR